MPRTLVRAPDHDRTRSLGWLATAWMEHFCRHGPGDVQGMPVQHGDEYTGFIVDCYALDEIGKLLYDSAFLSRPKGCDKSGLGSRFGLFEALGPCRFGGWARGGEVYEDPWGLGFEHEYEPGEPMGMSVHVPIIRVMATEESQPLALDTPVPTPTGWTTVGELSVGDSVIDAHGTPQRVARQTPVMLGMDCYAVTFFDGERIVCSGSHLWTMERRNDKGTAHERVTVTTEHLAKDYIRGGSQGGMTGMRYRVPAGVEWQLPAVELPVDPYLLGLWLGDGYTAGAGIAFDYRLRGEYEALLKPLLEDHEELSFANEQGNSGVAYIRRRRGLCPWGHEFGDDMIHRGCGPCRRIRNNSKSRKLGDRRTQTLLERLRGLDVLGNKHIPATYLRASAAQRHALLQGLMDSDGNFARQGKAVKAVFTNTNRRLIEGVEELLTTLGYKWSERYEPSVNAWRVNFVACASKPPARLAHKVSRLDVLGHNARSRRRHVVKVERVESVPVKCVGIDTDDHLFLVGRRAVPTHNTGNVYDSILFNLTDEASPLSEISGVDAGLTRVYLPGGGEIMPSTASSASKDGGRETWICLDETHLYNTPELRRMYNTVTRNLRKRKGGAGTWFLETTTMFAPGENSVAEATFTEAEAIRRGLKKRGRSRLLYDHRWGECADLRDEAALRAALAEAYGDALAWIDLDGLVDQFYDTRSTPEDSRRYFLNAETSSSDAWLKAHEWNGCKRVGGGLLKDRDLVTLGFDGSVDDDATALVACRVSDGQLELLAVWEKPEGPAGDDWRVPGIEVDAALAQAMGRFDVCGFFADPAHWQDYLDRWHLEFAAKMRVKATATRPLEWWTNRTRQMAAALERFYQAVREHAVGYTPDEDLAGRHAELAATFHRHVLNAHRDPRRGGVLIRKVNPKSRRKIDSCMAAVLAYEARSEAIAAGVRRRSEVSYAARRIR